VSSSLNNLYGVLWGEEEVRESYGELVNCCFDTLHLFVCVFYGNLCVVFVFRFRILFNLLSSYSN
jgi:hypothetical protein